MSSARIFKKIGLNGNLYSYKTAFKIEILTLAVPRCHFVHFWTDLFYKNPQNYILTPFWGMQPHTYFNSKLIDLQFDTKFDPVALQIPALLNVK